MLKLEDLEVLSVKMASNNANNLPSALDSQGWIKNTVFDLQLVESLNSRPADKED